MRRSATLATGAVAALLIATAPPVQADSVGAAAEGKPDVASWELAEAPGARSMVDSSANALHGVVGADVEVGLTWAAGQGPDGDEARGYRFPTVAPDELPVRPGHTVVVADDRVLDPINDDWAVEVRLRAAGPDGNVLQKGQTGNPGGLWKVELNAGEPTCLVRGPRGTNAVRARGVAVDDGGFHTIRCERTETAVDLWVDGRHVGRNTGDTGPVGNAQPMSVGGKQRCDQVVVGCDYFSGDLDWIRITRS